jgi:hypothetical protein
MNSKVEKNYYRIITQLGYWQGLASVWQGLALKQMNYKYFQP